MLAYEVLIPYRFRKATEAALETDEVLMSTCLFYNCVILDQLFYFFEPVFLFGLW